MSEVPPLKLMPPDNTGVTPDGVDEASSVRDSAWVALRRAVGAARQGGAADGELRRALRETCDEAHRRGLRAEQVVILLKETWRGVPVAQYVPRDEAEAALARMITLCIDEYYAPRGLTSPRR